MNLTIKMDRKLSSIQGRFPLTPFDVLGTTHLIALQVGYKNKLKGT